MSQFYVYEHITKDTNAVFYVGKGTGYRSGSKSDRNIHWKRVAKKHGFTVNIVAQNLDEELAFLCEQERIDQLRRLGVKLCNYTDGGEGISGHKHSEETKKKLSEKAIGRNVGHTFNVGRKQTKEWKEKISKSLFGNKYRLGIPHTKESIEKIKFHSAGKNNTMYGKIRITNGFENKIILPNDTIPDGWTRGMAKRGKK